MATRDLRVRGRLNAGRGPDAAGRMVAVRIATGSGCPHLDAAARDAVLANRCATHAENGAPSPMRPRAPITFNLDE
ncbi:hypothetical protein WS54_09895 [Burkholderia sp. NRF60-BP8]|nr:hypothetical protein WS54_09895 [Burkholderia sp. NRF60-BP8]